MTAKELKELIKDIPDDDAIIASFRHKDGRVDDFKISYVDDTTCVGVYELGLTEFETPNYWEI